MALTQIVVEIASENAIGQVLMCRIEGKPFAVSRTSPTSFRGQNEVDVVGLVQFAVAIAADSFTDWGVAISKAGSKPFVEEKSTVPGDTTTDAIAGVGKMS